jgi:hypothetical protein
MKCGCAVRYGISRDILLTRQIQERGREKGDKKGRKKRNGRQSKLPQRDCVSLSTAKTTHPNNNNTPSQPSIPHRDPHHHHHHTLAAGDHRRNTPAAAAGGLAGNTSPVVEGIPVHIVEDSTRWAEEVQVMVRMVPESRIVGSRVVFVVRCRRSSRCCSCYTLPLAQRLVEGIGCVELGMGLSLPVEGSRVLRLGGRVVGKKGVDFAGVWIV